MNLARTTLLAALLLSALVPASASADVVHFGSDGAGDGLRPFYHGGLAVAPSGDVYALDPDPHNRVLRFTSTLGFASTWGTSGSGHGEFSNPRAVAVDGSGNVLIGDGSRMQRFTPGGDYMSENGEAGEDLAVGAAGSVYVAGSSGLYKYDVGGNQVAQWTGVGATPTIGYLRGVAYDAAHDRVYSVDPNRNLVRVFDGDLNFIEKWGSAGGTAGKFDWPSDVAVSPSGDVYVSEPGTVGSTMRVQRFSSSGAFRGAYAQPQGQPGFFQPNDIAFDAAGRLYAASFTDLVRIDPDVPMARLSSFAADVNTSQRVTLDASQSSVPFAGIDRVSWDLDGDGSFETDGALSRETSFATAGRHTVGVRIEGGGRSDSAQLTFNVRQVGSNPGPYPVPLPSPQPGSGRGQVGVSIEAAALYTNDPKVTIDVDAPGSAATVTVSNDGGFKHARSFPAGRRIKWTLASTGPERLPKTVYVRFDVTGSQTYSDDIILDQTNPTVASATVEASTAASTRGAVAQAAASETHTYRVHIRAKDATSGVAKVQFAGNKKHPSSLRKFARTTRYKAARAPKYLRVQDRAGNFSRWRSVR